MTHIRETEAKSQRAHIRIDKTKGTNCKLAAGQHVALRWGGRRLHRQRDKIHKQKYKYINNFVNHS